MLLALGLMLSCSACGREPPAKIPVPPRLLSCAAEPIPPAPAGAGGAFTDAQASAFLVDVIEAGASCRNTVAAVKAWSTAQ